MTVDPLSSSLRQRNQRSTPPLSLFCLYLYLSPLCPIHPTSSCPDENCCVCNVSMPFPENSYSMADRPNSLPKGPAACELPGRRASGSSAGGMGSYKAPLKATPLRQSNGGPSDPLLGSKGGTYIEKEEALKPSPTLMLCNACKFA